MKVDESHLAAKSSEGSTQIRKFFSAVVQELKMPRQEPRIDLGKLGECFWFWLRLGFRGHGK